MKEGLVKKIILKIIRRISGQEDPSQLAEDVLRRTRLKQARARREQLLEQSYPEIVKELRDIGDE